MARLCRMAVAGFRALSSVDMPLGDLTVLIGPNATGKSSIADALAFANEAVDGPILSPVGVRGGMRSVVWNGLGQRVFSICLTLEGKWGSESQVLTYSFTVGAMGEEPMVYKERLDVLTEAPGKDGNPHTLFDRGRKGLIVEGIRRRPDRGGADERLESEATRARYEDSGSLAIGGLMPVMQSPAVWTVVTFLRQLRVYTGFDVSAGSPIRRAYDPASKTAPDAHLRPGGANLTGVVSVLKTDLSYAEQFRQLEEWVTLGFAGFEGLGVSQSVAGAELSLQWREYGRASISAGGQLSDGALRFLCLATLCASPRPPSMVIVDEPEIGLHPRLLPIVGGHVGYAIRADAGRRDHAFPDTA